MSPTTLFHTSVLLPTSLSYWRTDLKAGDALECVSSMGHQVHGRRACLLIHSELAQRRGTLRSTPVYEQSMLIGKSRQDFYFFFISLLSIQCKSINQSIAMVNHHNGPPLGQVNEPLFPELGRPGVEEVGNSKSSNFVKLSLAKEGLKGAERVVI